MRTFLIFISLLLSIMSKSKAQIAAVYVEDRVEITWDYSACNLINYYIIEKSKNGTNFKKILKVQNSKNNSTSFLETDNNPFDKTSFYRIRYVKSNGNYYYSEIVSVRKPNISRPLSKKLKGYNSLNVLVILKEKSNGEFYTKLNILENNGELVGETLNEKIKTGNFLVIASENDDLVGNFLKIINRNPNNSIVDKMNIKFQ